MEGLEPLRLQQGAVCGVGYVKILIHQHIATFIFRRRRDAMDECALFLLTAACSGRRVIFCGHAGRIYFVGNNCIQLPETQKPTAGGASFAAIGIAGLAISAVCMYSPSFGTLRLAGNFPSLRDAWCTEHVGE